MTSSEDTYQKPRVRIHNTIVYLLIVFSVSWGIDFILWRFVGLQSGALSLLILQLRMLIPALIAIILMRFYFRDSPIYYGHYQDKPLIFFYFFAFMVLVYAGLVVWGILDPGQAAVINALSGAINLLVIMALITIRIISDAKSFSNAWLVGGHIRDWLLWGLGLVIFYSAGTYLNKFFELGAPVNLNDLMNQLQLPADFSEQLFFVIVLLQSLVAGSLLGILLGFGEEFGWRGYLQSELFKIGKVKGVLLLGLIWGAWHYPLIWLGHNYPGHPALGIFLMTGYTLLLGIFLSHVMLKTGAIWLVAFLHALNNQTITFLNSFVYQVSDPAYSFSFGVWGLLLALPIVLLLLRDPIWKKD